MDASFLARLFLNGLVIGVMYALIAMRLSLIFGVLEIVNFAHGEFYMLGAMGAYFLTTNLGFGYWPTIATVTLTALCVGCVLYEALLVSLHGEGFERSILLTLGLSMVLQNGAVFLFTTTPKMLQTAQTYSDFIVGEVRVPVLRVYALGLGLAAFALLYAILYRTQVGKAMRGVAQNRSCRGSGSAAGSPAWCSRACRARCAGTTTRPGRCRRSAAASATAGPSRCPARVAE